MMNHVILSTTTEAEIIANAIAIKIAIESRPTGVFTNFKNGKTVTSSLTDSEAVFLLESSVRHKANDFCRDMAHKLNRFGNENGTRTKSSNGIGQPAKGLSDTQLFWCHTMALKELNRLTAEPKSKPSLGDPKAVTIYTYKPGELPDVSWHAQYRVVSSTDPGRREPQEESDGKDDAASKVKSWVDDMAGSDTREQILEKANALGLI